MASITISTDIAGGEENFFMLAYINLDATYIVPVIYY